MASGYALLRSFIAQGNRFSAYEKKGKAVQFFRLQAKASARDDWTEVLDLDEIFR